MFDHVDSVNNRRAGFRHIILLALAFLAVAAIVFFVSFPAFAGQEEDQAAASQPVEEVVLEEEELGPIDVVEEIDLGDQGIFPEGHVLATVHVDGDVYTVDTDGVSEDALNDVYGITLENQDYLETADNAYGYDVYVNRLTVETRTEETTLRYTSSRQADSNMYVGEEKITTYGETGVQTDTYEIRTLNGETTTTLVKSEVTKEPVNEVISYGTKEKEAPKKSESTSSSGSGSKSSGSGSSGSSSKSSGSGSSSSGSGSGSGSKSSGGSATGFKNNGSSLNLTSETIATVDTANKTFTTTGGTTYSYSKALNCTAYAYCIPGGTTASGTPARQGEVAVDPSVIPLGTRLFIIANDGSVVYGVATAEDTGGSAIRGNAVDLYYNSLSLCTQFGVRSVTVYILN